MIISDGRDYYGTLQEFDGVMVPHGMGLCKYPDHNERGMYQNGILCGVGLIESKDKIQIGMTCDNVINGWGMIVDKGEVTFGIFEDSTIKINLTPLIRSFFVNVMDEVQRHQKNPVVMRKKKEIFFGMPNEYFLFKKAGFLFCGNGEVFFGVGDEDEEVLTGKFLHFGLDYKITRGEYVDGELVRYINDVEFATAFHGVFASPDYFLVDINKDFRSMLSIFDRHLLLKVVEIGNTPDKLVVKGNPGIFVDNLFEYNTTIDQETIWFMFPIDNHEIMMKMLELEKRKEPWLPILSDYCIESVGFRSGEQNTIQTVFKHISCYNKNVKFDLDRFGTVDIKLYSTTWGEAGLHGDEEDDINNYEDSLCLIPELESKKETIEYIVKRDYAYPNWNAYQHFIKDHLASGEDSNWDFFVWLFNNDLFEYYTPDDLPGPYYSAYESFLYLFFDEEEFEEYED